MSIFVVDTHALVWYLSRDSRLSKRAEEFLDMPDATLVIPTVVLAEIKYLFRKKRVSIAFKNVMHYVEADPRCIIYPFDLPCVEKLDERLNLHDGVIVATALIYRDSIDSSTKLITKDKSIIGSHAIDTVW